MKSILFALTAVLFLCAVPAQAQQIPASAQQMQLSFAPLVKKTGPAVVNIYAKRIVRQRVVSPLFNDPFFSQFFGVPFGGGGVRERTENSLGSGVIVDPSGLIATNTHVISGAVEIIAVTADGRELSAEKIVADDKTDLAVLKIQPKGESLSWLELADSDALQVGDLVLAIGNPFGVGQTVTSGIVSALARTVSGPGDYNFFIQTDAAINPGNSGGALVDMDGRLVGINSMIFSKDGGSLGIGFAIPSSMVKTVIEASRHGGKIIRPWMGVTGQAVTPDMVESLGLDRAQGALVNKVYPGSSADRAGIKPGDVILAVDGKPVQDPEAMKFRVATLPVGATVKLQVWRNGKTAEREMVTEAAPENPPRDETLLDGAHPLSGATVANISPAVLEDIGGLSEDQGVVVLKTEGSAARLGIGRKDVILAVNGQKVESVRELKKILGKSGVRRWQFQILRGQQVLNLMIAL